MGIEKAKAELQQLQDQVDRIFGEQSRQESSIQAAQQAGLVSELAARQQLLDLHRSTADEVEQLVPRMEELAKATGDPAAIERVKDLRQQLENTRVAADQLTLALRSGIENGMQDALRGLADGTLSLQEAAVSFLQAVSRSLADVAAQQLAQKATAGLMSLFGQGEQDTSMVTGAAAVTSAAGALSTAGGTLVAGAAAIQEQQPVLRPRMDSQVLVPLPVVPVRQVRLPVVAGGGPRSQACSGSPRAARSAALGLQQATAFQPGFRIRKSSSGPRPQPSRA